MNLKQVIKQSENHFLKSLFNDVVANDLSKRTQVTLSSQFRVSLDILMKALGACQPFFIRCIKPNENKQPNVGYSMPASWIVILLQCVKGEVILRIFDCSRKSGNRPGKKICNVKDNLKLTIFKPTYLAARRLSGLKFHIKVSLNEFSFNMFQGFWNRRVT